jgi:hypothetical protein
LLCRRRQGFREAGAGRGSRRNLASCEASWHGRHPGPVGGGARSSRGSRHAATAGGRGCRGGGG